MKKIIFDPVILQSRQPMVEAIYRLQVQEENCFHSRMLWEDLKKPASLPKQTEYEMYMEHLLQPPDIVRVEFDGEEAVLPIIFISMANNAGSIRLFVCIRDGEGNLIDSDRAFYMPGSGTEWGVVIQKPLPPGTELEVSVKAFDCVGGVRVKHCRFILP